MEEHLYAHFYSVENRHWWFAARQRILETYVLKKIPLPSGARLLDVGSGTGAILEMFSRRFEAFGQDVSPQAVAFCRKRGLKNVYCGALDTMPPEVRDFDLITTLDVIEHVDDDVAALRQMRALLKPAGKLLVTVPAFPFLWGGHDVMTHHKRRYRRITLRKALAGAGFAVETMSYFNCMLFPVALARRLAARFLGATEANDLEMPPKVLNALMRRVFESEKYLLPFTHLPVGLSLIAVARQAEP